MKYTTISYERVKNLGDYNSERMGAAAELEEGDDLKKALKATRKEIEIALGITPEPEIKAEPAGEAKEEPKAPAKRGRKPKAEKSTPAKEEQRSDKKGEASADDTDAKNTASKPPKKKGTKTTYSRTIPTHRNLFKGLTVEVLGEDWTQNADYKPLVKKLSEEYSDKDLNPDLEFLGDDGNILESFKERYKADLGV